MTVTMSVSASDTAPTTQYLTGLKLFTILASLTLVTFLVLLDSSIIGTAIPRITTEFHSLPDVGWYIGAYSLATATLQPMSGKLYTYFRSKAVFLSFVFMFELGSLICAVARSSVVLIVGRAIAGLGASGIYTGAMIVLTGAVPREKSPFYTGILFGTSQMGIVLGPLIGGVLTEHVSWRWCFWINLPIGGVAAAVISLIRIPEVITKPPFSMALVQKIIPHLDLIGFALFVPWSVMLLLALQLGSSGAYSWDSRMVIGLFCGTGVCIICFAVWEKHMGDRAMVPVTLLRRRFIWTSYVYGSCVTTCMATASNWLPTYFQAVKDNGPTASGVYVLPSILSQILLVVVTGAAVERTRYHLPFAFSGGVITAIGNGLVSTFTASTNTATWIGYQIVMGGGRGLCMQMALVVVQNAVSPAEYPVAIACLIFFQFLAIKATRQQKPGTDRRRCVYKYSSSSTFLLFYTMHYTLEN
ncbi:MFS multidrug transporter [Pyrenophora tritici-repentis]|nr:MFS multidrug transporter [Pyrenophora tritici-repentis]